MKYDLTIILTEELCKLYSFPNEFGTMNILYKYLYIKCGLAIDKKKITNNELINFILEELNIDIFGKEGLKTPYIIYYDEEYPVFQIEKEFIENLEFRADLEGDINLKPLIKYVYDKGYSKSIKYKKLNCYKTYIKYNRLMVLNEKLGIPPSISSNIKGFKQNKNHNPFKRSLEETLKANIDAYKLKGSKTTTYITEEQLEDYIVKNIELIEKDMKYIGRQVEVPGGRVDILAKDKYNNICVIEIKINEDKSIIWQSMYYPVEIKKKYKADKVRMITIAPSYSEGLLNTLKSLDNVEILKYNINVIMGSIENLCFTMIK